jgi:hypothetical protein
MTASAAPILDAIAFQLAAALDKYDQDSEKLICGWLDMDLYREVSEQIDHIRMYSSALPEARVQWVELLIAHSELVHSLWRTEYGKVAQGEGQSVADVRARHADCIAALRNRCVRLISRSG